MSTVTNSQPPATTSTDPTPANDVLFGSESTPAPSAAAPAAPATTSNVVIPENWKDMLDDDVKVHTSMEKIKDIKSLARSYINAQKMIGADKVPVPPKGAAPEVMREFFQKVGLPDKEENYKIELSGEAKVDKDFMDKFRKTAYAQNILPDQAKALAEWFAKENDAAFIEQTKKYEDGIREGLNNLKREWGNGYDNEVAKAKAALRNFADKDTQEFIKSAGLGNNPLIIKMLAKAGALLAEDKIRGEGGSVVPMYTPQQAREKIKELKGTVGSAYFDPKHADHVRIRNEVSKLYSMAFPGQKGDPKESY